MSVRHSWRGTKLLESLKKELSFTLTCLMTRANIHKAHDEVKTDVKVKAKTEADEKVEDASSVTHASYFMGKISIVAYGSCEKASMIGRLVRGRFVDEEMITVGVDL